MIFILKAVYEPVSGFRIECVIIMLKLTLEEK